MTRPRILVDLREADNSRGFHVLAAMTLVAGRLDSPRLYYLGGHSSDERVAALAFAFDNHLRLRRPWGFKWRRFDLFVSARNNLPADDAFNLAHARSTRTVLALLFPAGDPGRGENCVTVSGHDTREIGETVLRELLMLSLKGD